MLQWIAADPVVGSAFGIQALPHVLGVRPSTNCRYLVILMHHPFGNVDVKKHSSREPVRVFENERGDLSNDCLCNGKVLGIECLQRDGNSRDIEENCFKCGSHSAGIGDVISQVESKVD